MSTDLPPVGVSAIRIEQLRDTMLARWRALVIALALMAGMRTWCSRPRQ